MARQQIIAEINPGALVWAREVRGMPLEVAANKIGIKTEKLQALEAGEANPTMRQLLAIGRVYRKPTAFFYLLTLPEQPERPHDFRRLPDIVVPPSPELIDAVARAKERRLDAIELRQSLDMEIPSLQLIANPNMQPSKLAEDIRHSLGILVEQQQSWREPYKAFRSWVTAAELAGILVFQFSNVGLDDARGFSIAERPLPVVAINGKDWPRAKIFTLIHEIAHIALNAAGICDLHVADEDSNSIEIFCNEVAGEMLVPAEYLKAEPTLRGHKSSIWTEMELSQLSERFSVSREVVLRRLLSLGYTSIDFYQTKRREFIAAAIETREREGGFLGHSRRVLRDNGRAFTSLVLQAYSADLITNLDVSRLLGGVKLRHVDSIMREL
jgi:Zn-dependent peptidase ImmA (M78 family)